MAVYVTYGKPAAGRLIYESFVISYFFGRFVSYQSSLEFEDGNNESWEVFVNKKNGKRKQYVLRKQTD